MVSGALHVMAYCVRKVCLSSASRLAVTQEITKRASCTRPYCEAQLHCPVVRSFVDTGS